MQKVKIQNELSNNDYSNFTFFKYIIFEFLFELNLSNFKTYIYILISIIIVIITIVDKIYYKNVKDLKKFKKYVKDCKDLVKYDRKKKYNKYPYISVCLSALNMENYIEKNLLSILNQSYQNFEIVIVNDFSTDDTENIINNIQLEDDRIKLISHNKNLGVYRSRIESILNSKSEYVLLMDPDDMYLNENLFQDLYNINKKNNFDIIEFSVYQQHDGHSKIYFPDNHYESHYHQFSKNIIYQPELSNILFYIPGTKIYSHTICRNIWNKLIRRDIYVKTNKYIGKEYYDEFIITADDMIMNIVTYHFAKNYTNIELPGYLYIIRKVSMSRGDGGIKLKYIRAMNHLLYFKIFYKYILEYNKDRNFLFYEMKDLNRFLVDIKDCNMTKYIPTGKNFINKILADKYISDEFTSYLEKLTLYLTN